MTTFKTVFLDRDGTIIQKAEEGDYIRRPDDVVLLEGAADAVGMLNRADIRTVIVTNQRGVDLGLMTAADVTAVNDRLRSLLGERGAWVDALYVCPHGADTCDCRKPLPGLLFLAAREHPGLHLSEAVMVGDSETDVLAGRAAGACTVLLGKGHESGSLADSIQANLLAAVGWILMGGERHQRS
jgi:D-glycero-D-manno-heptose 1,7-bisphosphate phosphatase